VNARFIFDILEAILKYVGDFLCVFFRHSSLQKSSPMNRDKLFNFG